MRQAGKVGHACGTGDIAADGEGEGEGRGISGGVFEDLAQADRLWHRIRDLDPDRRSSWDRRLNPDRSCGEHQSEIGGNRLDPGDLHRRLGEDLILGHRWAGAPAGHSGSHAERGELLLDHPGITAVIDRQIRLGATGTK